MATSVLHNHQLPSKIIDIIKESKKYCFIVSPYYQPWYQLEKAIELSEIEEKRLIFLFRDDQQNNNDIGQLRFDCNFDIFFIKNLHAKIYLNENEALISSMNLYDYSKENNFEIGYLISNRIEAKEIAKKIIINEMIKTWCTDFYSGRYYDEINESMFDNNIMKSSVQNKNYGYCLRCGQQIMYNLHKPFCNKCFVEWNNYQNYSYEEKNCHNCGKSEATSMSKPLCIDCFKRITNIKII